MEWGQVAFPSASTLFAEDDDRGGPREGEPAEGAGEKPTASLISLEAKGRIRAIEDGQPRSRAEQFVSREPQALNIVHHTRSFLAHGGGARLRGGQAIAQAAVLAIPVHGSGSRLFFQMYNLLVEFAETAFQRRMFGGRRVRHRFVNDGERLVRDARLMGERGDLLVQDAHGRMLRGKGGGEFLAALDVARQRRLRERRFGVSRGVDQGWRDAKSRARIGQSLMNPITLGTGNFEGLLGAPESGAGRVVAAEFPFRLEFSQLLTRQVPGGLHFLESAFRGRQALLLILGGGVPRRPEYELLGELRGQLSREERGRARRANPDAIARLGERLDAGGDTGAKIFEGLVFVQIRRDRRVFVQHGIKSGWRRDLLEKPCGCEVLIRGTGGTLGRLARVVPLNDGDGGVLRGQTGTGPTADENAEGGGQSNHQ